MRKKTVRSQNDLSNVPRMPPAGEDGKILSEEDYKIMKKTEKKERRTKARAQRDEDRRRAELCARQDFRCRKCDATVRATANDFPLFRSKCTQMTCPRPACKTMHVLSYGLEKIAAEWPVGQVRARAMSYHC